MASPSSITIGAGLQQSTSTLGSPTSGFAAGFGKPQPPSKNYPIGSSALRRNTSLGSILSNTHLPGSEPSVAGLGGLGEGKSPGKKSVVLPNGKRRIWVKKNNGTPTSLYVSPYDMVDDLKLQIVQKYPTTLARQFDPADLNVYMPVPETYKANSTSQTGAQSVPQSLLTSANLNKSNTSNSGMPNLGSSPDQSYFQPFNAASPLASSHPLSIISRMSHNNPEMSTINDTLERASSPLDSNSTTTQKKIRAFSTSQDSNYSIHSGHVEQQSGNEQKMILLRPDQVIWSLLDTYFPGTSMTMADSLIIDMPAISNDTVTSMPNHVSMGYHMPTGQAGYDVNSGDAASYMPVAQDQSYMYSSMTSAGPAPHQQSGYEMGIQERPQEEEKVSTAVPQKPTTFLMIPKDYGLPAHEKSKAKETATEKPAESKDSVDIPAANPSFSTSRRGSAHQSVPPPISIPKPQKSEALSDTKALASNNARIRALNKEERLARRRKRLEIARNRTLQADQALAPPSATELRDKSPEQQHMDSVVSIHSDRLISPSPTRFDQTKQAEYVGSASPLNVAVFTDDGWTHMKKEKSEPQFLPHRRPLARNSVNPDIKVLIVEDNPINVKLTVKKLEACNVEYGIANNGREAITEWKKGEYQLILMDIQLPIMSGIEATTEIRRLERINKVGVYSFPKAVNDNVPDEPVAPEDWLDRDVFKSSVIIVALTASSLLSDREKALAAGCNDYLLKPVNYDWLYNKIMEWGCMQALIYFDKWVEKNVKNKLEEEHNEEVKEDQGNVSVQEIPAIEV